MPPHLASFDSGTTLVRALGRYLDGEDFPALGLVPRTVARAVPVVNIFPRRVRQWLYRYGSAREAIPPDRLASFCLDDVRRWVTDRYPRRGYPAVLVGSANGAAVHLAALLGVPWLPQTFLVPVRRDCPPDAIRESFEWGKRYGRNLLDGNPDLKLHHMHDPNQDRLPIERLAYFRVKCLRLGRAYQEFLETVLAPGGTIVLVENTQQWPVTRVSDRHVFQFGGVGGLSPDQYHHGDPVISEFLTRQGSSHTHWDPPEPTDHEPEAEWGFEPALRTDVRRFATSHDYSVRTLSFDRPARLSPMVAELYRDWYTECGLPDSRLVVDSFAQIDPWWTLRTGSVPFWLPFVTNDDARSLESYLDSTDPYDEIYLSLFSHGVESIGLAPIDRWRSNLDRARTRGRFLGVTPEKHPVDFGTYVRYNLAFPKMGSARRPIASPLPVDRFESWMDGVSADDAVEWTSLQ